MLNILFFYTYNNKMVVNQRMLINVCLQEEVTQGQAFYKTTGKIHAWVLAKSTELS